MSQCSACGVVMPMANLYAKDCICSQEHRVGCIQGVKWTQNVLQSGRKTL